MAYEFIATGIRPAQPVKAYLDAYRSGREMIQNEAINKVNLESAGLRNEAAALDLQSAKKQVTAETQWAKLPRDQAGRIDSQAEQQFKNAFPEYYDVRKKAETEDARGQLGLVVDKLKTASTLFGNAKSPEDIEKARTFAKENLGLDLKYDEAVFGKVQQYSTELAQKSELISEDIATAAAAGDWETVTALQSARNAEANLARLEVLKAQAGIERDLAAAEASRAQAFKARQVSEKAQVQKRKEVDALASVNSLVDIEIRNIDKLIGSKDGSVKQHPGLRSMVGSLDPRFPTVMTDTANAEALLKSLQSKASIDALRDIRSGGSQSIGQITEREWPRLESMKATLQETQGTKQFIESLAEYRDELLQTKRDSAAKMDEFLSEQEDSTAAERGSSEKRLSPTEAKKLAPGAKFIGLDGVERTRN